MVKLLAPNEQYLRSYREANDEYIRNQVRTYSFSDGTDCDILEKFDNYKFERNLKPNRVGADFYWLVDDESQVFLGEISIRHRLTDALLRYGGHIGYGIRYSQWNKGYGTLLLKLALEKAGEMGLHEVLTTCDDDNAASAKVMEKNGMELRDKVINIIDGQTVITRRYWKII